MRLLLSSILVSLIFTAGCSKNDDVATTGEPKIDKADDISQDRAEALKELDAMHEATTAGDAVQDTANDAMKDQNK